MNENQVKIYGGKNALGLLPDLPAAPSAKHEYGTLEVTVEVVNSMDEAINHIHNNGSGHTEVIITESEENAKHFLRTVDSA